MAWPKGKPRLSDEERAARAQRSERTLYPAMWEYVGCYYCPQRINGPFVSGRDDVAFDEARAKMQEHVKEAHPAGTERKVAPKAKPKAKADAVLVGAIDAEAEVADKTLRERVSRGRI